MFGLVPPPPPPFFFLWLVGCKHGLGGNKADCTRQRSDIKCCFALSLFLVLFLRMKDILILQQLTQSLI